MTHTTAVTVLAVFPPLKDNLTAPATVTVQTPVPMGDVAKGVL